MDLEKITPLRNVLTVSDLTRMVKQLLDSNYTDLWVSGEVSNFYVTPNAYITAPLLDTCISR